MHYLKFYIFLTPRSLFNMNSIKMHYSFTDSHKSDKTHENLKHWQNLHIFTEFKIKQVPVGRYLPMQNRYRT